MTFGKPRYNKNYEYELLRYCSNYSVIGGVENQRKELIDSDEQDLQIQNISKSESSDFDK